MNSDYKELLQLFADNEVKYLIIGGYAYMYHVEPRYTKDLDVWVKPDPENAEKVFRSLAEFGAPLKNEDGTTLTSDDFAHPGFYYQVGYEPVRVDVLMSVKGGSFDESWGHRVEAKFEQVPLLFVSREDLIALKIAADRPQDRVDVDNLRLAELRERERTFKKSPQQGADTEPDFEPEL